MTDPRTETFDQLAAAAGRFCAEVAERAHRAQPAVHETWDALLKSGECCTNVTIRLFDGGVRIRAVLSKISDGEELLVLDEADAVAVRSAQ